MHVLSSKELDAVVAERSAAVVARLAEARQELSAARAELRQAKKGLADSRRREELWQIRCRAGRTVDAKRLLSKAGL